MINSTSIVCGLGYGDEGKGLVTSTLANEASSPICVRFSGGQQAGHNVVLDNGTNHIHSNYASGAVLNVPSYFTEHCTMYLPNLIRESDILKDTLGNRPKLTFHPLCNITTPYDVIYNRIKESALSRDGSCGLGVGATFTRINKSHLNLKMIDLLYPKMFKVKVSLIKSYYDDLIKNKEYLLTYYNDQYTEQLEEDIKVFDKFCDIYSEYFDILDYEYLLDYGDVIFEGSQGIMLDMDHGIFPNVTYSNTTCKNAVEVCNKLGISYDVYEVTRVYSTRHGKGWINNIPLPPIIEDNINEHNVYNEWQHNFHSSGIDVDLLHYAHNVNKLYYDYNYHNSNLVITCMDHLVNPTGEYNKIYNKLSHQYNDLYVSASSKLGFSKISS